MRLYHGGLAGLRPGDLRRYLPQPAAGEQPPGEQM